MSPRLTFCKPLISGFPFFISICAALIIESVSHAQELVIHFRMFSPNCGHYMPMALPSVKYLYKFDLEGVCESKVNIL